MFKQLAILMFVFMPFWVLAQTGTINGTLIDQQTGLPVVNAKVSIDQLSLSTQTETDGTYSLAEVPFGTYTLTIADGVHAMETITLVLETASYNVGSTSLRLINATGQLNGEELIPVMSLNELENDNSSVIQNVSGILSASNDVFIQAASFSFSPLRFKIRGYDSENSMVFMNGVPMNDLESGFVQWGAWGGLNDVTRSRESNIGLMPTQFTFGGPGGAIDVNSRASDQRRQLRASYAMSNRSYRNRAMLTYSSGWLPGGWAFSASASHRWAEEGFMPGTNYNAWSFYLSAEKKIGKNHSIALTAFNAPTIRGRSTSITKEQADIAGSNFYNPDWGYQAGEKRNASQSFFHQPIFILNHDWTINEQTSLNSAFSYQFGRNGVSGLSWYQAQNPLPNYYRRWPSYAEDESAAQGALVEEQLRADESLRQIDWDGFFDTNRNSPETIQNANGIVGNTFTGNRAHYFLEDRRNDMKRFNANVNLQHNVNDHLTVNSGLIYQYQHTHYFKVMEDLLGADFHLDIDNFADLDSAATNPSFQFADLNQPNRIVREGDVFGYDYAGIIHQTSLWGQMDFKFKHFDFFLSADVKNTVYWRKGNYQTGQFPDNSLGESPRHNFIAPSVKGGITYKINGRNYLFANGAVITRAPYFRNAFISPRTRYQVVDELPLENIYSVEGGYLLRAPNVKARVVGYYTRMNNQIFNRTLFLDDAFYNPATQQTASDFGNLILSNLDKQYAGLELALEFKLTNTIRMSAVAALGQYIYANRPDLTIASDNNRFPARTMTAYLKNYHLAEGPEQAFTVAFKYNSPDFWFFNLNVNYFRNNWMDVYPYRRTIEAVSTLAPGTDPDVQEQAIEPGSELWNQILDQEKLPAALTVDVFGGKSWKFNKTFLYLTVGVSNLFNNTNIITGGFEQFRFDNQDKNVSKFPNRYFYGLGTNFFVQLAVKI